MNTPNQNILDIPIEFKPKSTSSQLRLKELSYSSLGTFQKCPKRYLLDKTLPTGLVARDSSVTFAFGHAVGEGIQQSLLGKTREQILFAMFLIWDVDLLDEMKAAKKSFALAVLAVDKFREYAEASDLSEYEVAEINGKPAVELSFKLHLPNGFQYRGYMDVVLTHKHSKKLMVLEIKTSGAGWLHEAMYKNSPQGLGYALVLASQLQTTSALEVRYLVYRTKAMEFEQFHFMKTLQASINWVNDLLADTKAIGSSTFPMRGAFCFDFFRACKYLDMCELSDSSLAIDYEAKSVDTEVYTLELNLLDIISGLEKVVITTGGYSSD